MLNTILPLENDDERGNAKEKLNESCEKFRAPWQNRQKCNPRKNVSVLKYDDGENSNS